MTLSPTTHSSTRLGPHELYRHWIGAKEDNTRLRARDLAQSLGVSEGELLAARCGVEGEAVERLEGDWAQLIRDLGACGTVMCLTRNDHAVIERHGVYDPVEIDGPVGVVTDEGIDLRLFMMRWKHGFAVDYPTPKGIRPGFQFFDPHGTAIHKVYAVVGETNMDAWSALKARYLSTDQSPGVTVAPKPAPPEPTPDDDIDVEGFQAAWEGMTDTHEFFPMLHKFGVARDQAMRLGPPHRIRKVGAPALQKALELARDGEIPIMVFVGSPGCIEIHSGPIKNVKVIGDWVNVLDPEFNLHVMGDAIGECYHVIKPTEDGDVNSLEVFADDGSSIALMFGKRKPGIPELESWRALLAQL